MKQFLFLLVGIIISKSLLFAEEPAGFDTKWIPSKPEMLTYKSTSKQGSGLYQVSISKSETSIEIYLNIITSGFTKTVSGTMGFDMKPLQSKSKIIVNGQVIMDTECSYESDRLHIATVMKPYNQTIKNELPFSQMVVDFSQLPLLVRTLPLKIGTELTFQSLNPQTNAIVPFTLKVVGEGVVQKIVCYKVESNDFEGQSILWIEKGDHRRIIRVEQPSTNRVTELI